MNPPSVKTSAGLPVADGPPLKLGSMNHLRLTVTDIPRAEEFYGSVLSFMGYRLVEKGDKRLAWAGWAAHGNLQWVIVSVANPASDNKRHDRYSPGLHHFAWNADSRDQVDRLYALLRDMGATVLDPPAEYTYEPGYYAVFFADPDGMKLELVFVPKISSDAYWAAATGSVGTP